MLRQQDANKIARNAEHTIFFDIAHKIIQW